MTLLKAAGQTADNTEEIIEVAYDLQTGSYVAAMADSAEKAHKVAYGKAIADVIQSLGACSSLLEAAVGEATTLSHVLDESPAIPSVHGCDISWSRVKCASEWLNACGHSRVALCVASLFALPYADDSFDVVYTSHSIEPNAGREAEALRELYRVSSRYVVLLEPGYELASKEARERMEKLGYCRALPATAQALGMKVIRHEMFPFSQNPLNPTALTIIEKAVSAGATPSYICPKYQAPLTFRGDCYYSSDVMRAYPIIGGVPCFRRESAIIAGWLSRG